MLVSSSASLLYILVLGTNPAFGDAPSVGDASIARLPAEAIPDVTGQVRGAAPASASGGRAAPTLGAPIDVERLDDLRGGDSTVDNDVTIDGTVDGNSAAGIVSGSNVIGGGAFDSSTGINTVIQNSGSNVLIQNGMVVNVQFVPPAP